MALQPCHGLITQFDVRDGHLNCSTYQRSADVFLGLSWNIPFYALFTEVVAHLTGLKAGILIYTIGNGHLYLNHIDQAKELLTREPDKYKLPELRLNPSITNIDDFKMEDIEIIGYESYPKIAAPVAV